MYMDRIIMLNILFLNRNLYMFINIHNALEMLHIHFKGLFKMKFVFS